MFSKYNDEGRVMHLKGANIEFMIYDNANEVFKERFLIDIKLDWEDQ